MARRRRRGAGGDGPTGAAGPGRLTRQRSRGVFRGLGARVPPGMPCSAKTRRRDPACRGPSRGGAGEVRAGQERAPPPNRTPTRRAPTPRARFPDRKRTTLGPGPLPSGPEGRRPAPSGDGRARPRPQGASRGIFRRLDVSMLLFGPSLGGFEAFRVGFPAFRMATHRQVPNHVR